MTDGPALLRAILEAPDDDAPRLIYADWLDEHGEPERAEFIRLEIELRNTKKRTSGRSPRSQPSNKNSKMLRHWQLKQQDMVAHMDLRQIVGHGLMLVDVEYTENYWGSDCLKYETARGFVHAITCTAADWLAHADAITAQHPVREVTLTTWPDMREFSTTSHGYVIESSPYGREATIAALSKRWPGICFKLPVSYLRSEPATV